MKRFEFRLGRLARVRHVQEEIARARWMGAERAAREAEARLARAELELEGAQDHLRASQTRPSIDAREVLDVRGTIELMEQRREGLRSRARLARDSAERERAPWQAVRAELEGLTRLEEKAKSAHRFEREREEAKQIDQIASERRRRDDPFQRSSA